MPYADVNGARLWYVDEGAGDPVLLLHHGLGDGRAWDVLAPTLAERYRVVRPDVRFFGRSTAPEVAFSPVDDLTGLLDHLAIERAAVVGHSFGGRIAIDFTLERPGRVRALAAIAPGLGGYALAPFTPGQQEAIEGALAAGELERAVELELSVWAPLGTGDGILELARANAGTEAVDVDPLWAEPPAADRLAEIAVPTLLVTGGRDVPDMTAIGDLLEARVPKATRIVFPEADHFIPQRDPDRVAQALIGFLDAV